MIIIALADIHGFMDYFEQDNTEFCRELNNADAVVIAGDITNFKGRQEAQRVLSKIRCFNENVFAVPGNCDLPGVDEYMRSEGINLNCNRIDSGGVTFTGLGSLLPCSRHGNDDTAESDSQTCIEHIAAMTADSKTVVFVSHKPACDTKVDRIGGGHYSGSMAVRFFIESYQPALAVSGHIHEAAGTDRIGKTTLVNPGSLREGSYAHIELNGETVKTDIRFAG
ncbi:MAG: metallophosphoesterase family protein [Anaerohalosphaera sp.]|nr:metallophosphoesterase family protein [Anaerohalosphaera sp.]